MVAPAALAATEEVRRRRSPPTPHPQPPPAARRGPPLPPLPLPPLLLPLLLLALAAPRLGAAIDCFKCVSLNGQYPPCDDPFHNNHTDDILEAPCMGGRKGRNGLFPATACIKLSGVYDNGDRITVRGCALDSGTLTTDTEIVRMSHCGGFIYDNRYVRGCLQSCDDADACNSAPASALAAPAAATALAVGAGALAAWGRGARGPPDVA